MHLPPRSKGKIDVHSERSPLAKRVGLPALTFIHTAETGGAVLLLAAIIALAWANSPWSHSYHALFEMPVELRIGDFSLAPPGERREAHPDEPASGTVDEGEAPGTSGGGSGDEQGGSNGEQGGPGGTQGEPSHGMTLHHWINDGLMVIFFFVVGLEIKRELVHGELASVRKAALPAAIALGGMIVPAGIYAILNAVGPGGAMRGWGVPMATDIAFALGVLALLGDRVPNPIRVLLLAFAIVDDIGAILVIALFYTEQLSFVALGLAFLLLGVIFLMRAVGVLDIGPYLFVGALIWACMLSSGVHATVAGVILGLMTPSVPWLESRRYSELLDDLQEQFNAALRDGDEEMADVMLGRIEYLTRWTESVLDRLVRLAHGYSAYVVLPIFALANAGVALDPKSIGAAAGTMVMWGVLLGLLFGKPIGTTGLAWLAARAGLVELPNGATWKQVFGIGLLGGVGFTVALFVTDLAFGGSTNLDAAKIGILAASLLSGVAGLVYLRITLPAPGRDEVRDQQAETAH